MTKQLKQHIDVADRILSSEPLNKLQDLGKAEFVVVDELIFLCRELVAALKECKKELDWVQQQQERLEEAATHG